MPEQSTGYGLIWADEDDDGALEPVWTAIPDIPTIQQLAAGHLSLDEAAVVVKFYAEGAFNKLYLVSSPDLPQKYLMRVALPVDPFFKTESEVATIAFLRKHTSLPVPKVISYSSSADNNLRFEWVLLEYTEGAPLSDLWEGMSFDAKSDLTIRMLECVKGMRTFSFSCFGNLYFSKYRERVNGKPAQWLNNSTNNPENDPEFVIGRIAHPWFFRDKRLHLNANRGPFKSSCELMLAKTDMQIERVKHLSPNTGDDYYSYTNEYLAKGGKDVLETCNGLRDLVPASFPQDTEELRVLYHHDLSDNNIILNPESLEINGIIDWESVGICPGWHATQVPYFLMGIEVPEPPPIRTPGVDESGLVEIRKDWERVRLRELFRNGLPEAIVTDDIMRKLHFESLLEDIELRWTAARAWLPALADPNSEKWKYMISLFIC
ncbi:phosphotransferase enzyme family-domain-containing protein [Aspergillus californicus]